MIRRISRNEARSLSRRMRDMDSRCCGSSCRRRDEKGEDDACDALEVEALVDLAVDALADYGVEEIDYEELDEEDRPDENEAICTDEEGNEVGVTVDLDGKKPKLTIDLDEDEDIVVDLCQPVADVKSEIQEDLEEKLAEQEEKEECNRRFEAWKRARDLRREGKRIGRKDR